MAIAHRRKWRSLRLKKKTYLSIHSLAGRNMDWFRKKEAMAGRQGCGGERSLALQPKQMLR